MNLYRLIHNIDGHKVPVCRRNFRGDYLYAIILADENTIEDKIKDFLNRDSLYSQYPDEHINITPERISNDSCITQY